MTNERFNLLKNTIEKASFSNQDLIQSFNGDGRLTSAISESLIIDFLRDLFIKNNISITIEVAPIRHWYDFLIKFEDGESIPVNLKITTGNQADNISSRKGMFYALTGISPDKIRGLERHVSFNEQLLKNYNPYNHKDYFFVIYFKDTETFLFTSLKRIETLTPNGSNLPFQCKWKNNLIYTQRDEKEQSEYILNTFIDSFIKKASGLNILLKWRDENG